MIKILHYAPNVGNGSLLEAYITDLVHGTQDVAEVRVAYNYAEAQKQKLRHLKDAFEKSSASFVEVNPEIDYTKILYSYFQKK